MESASVREHDAMVHTDGDGRILLISLIVHGQPVPQGSKSWMPKSQTLISDNDKKLRPWRAQLAEEMRALGVQTLLGPISAEMTFYLQRPQHHWGTGRNAGTLKASAPEYQSGYPDVDKLQRAVFDALQESALVRNDGQIAVVTAVKRYAQTPGVHLKLRPLG